MKSIPPFFGIGLFEVSIRSLLLVRQVFYHSIKAGSKGKGDERMNCTSSDLIRQTLSVFDQN